MKLSDRAKQIITAVAPTLGATIGGPLGGLAGSILSQTLGVKPDEANGKAVENAILGQSPEVIGQIRLAEIELQKTADSNDIELERVNATDRADARARQIALKDHTPAILGYAVVGITFFLEGYGLIHGFGKDVDPVVMGRILGTFDTATAMILTYFFGSSSGSKDKTDALTTIATRS